jgi:hypothetical protein
MTVQQIVDLLNDAVKCDAVGIAALISQRVPCNDALANHPTIQCVCPETPKTDDCRVGLVGLLNGIAAIDGELIEAMFDGETMTLLGFRLRDIE